MPFLLRARQADSFVANEILLDVATRDVRLIRLAANILGLEAGDRMELTSPTVQGTVSAGAGLTMPAFTLSGDISAGAYKLIFTETMIRSEGGLYARLLIRNPADSASMPIQALAFMTDNLRLKEGSATRFDVRDAADTADRDLLAATLMPVMGIAYATGSGAAPFDTGNADGAGVSFRARDTGVGLAEVARLIGANPAYWQFSRQVISAVVGDAFLPSADNQGNIGSATRRWALMRATTITSGDFCFENGWRLTEDDECGVVLLSPTGRKFGMVEVQHG